MSESSLRTHPLVVIAATTVILTCLLAIGIMAGILPSPLAKDHVTVRDGPAATAPPTAAALTDSRATQKPPRDAGQERALERAPVGAGNNVSESRTVTGGERTPRAAAVCTSCGTVTSVRAVTRQGEAGLLGPAAGGAIGGLVGSQIGGGSGRTIATIVGAAGGAAVGTELERRHKSTTHYVVAVRLNDGTHRSFNYGGPPGLREGDKVRIVDGRLVRNS